jgi:hypothetical protein
MSNFKIQNFCDEHNEEFKIYYNYLNNPIYIAIYMKCLSYMNHPVIKTKIFELIIRNKKYIYDKLDKIDTIIYFYEQNNLIKKSDIGKFFIFYKKQKESINIRKNKDLFEFFYKLISYENLLSVLKECFYIFSDYRACVYYMTPSVNFHSTKKNILNNVVKHFKDNINTLNQIISKIYIGDENPWGSPYYSTAYSMFETLMILKKYYKDPLEKINIKFNFKEKYKQSQTIKILKTKIGNVHCNKKMENINHFILLFKKMGYNLWFIVPTIFNSIFKKYTFNGIPESNIIGNKLIYQQKLNNVIGAMIFILVKHNFISNLIIFNNTNI